MNAPNVIFVLTDDQGYPDLGCTGNPWIQTPCVDEFSRESVRLNDFHVAPLCAPTRGALMSGHRPTRNGVWATCWGRSLLNAEEKILPQYFQEAGYVTGMFGKWHLGDNYPFRPQDRGFDRVVAHKGGGVGQTPDFWGNNYFDDTYFHDGKPEKYDGYCTDVWFEQGMRFIEENKDHPFFCYIATNAPHQPYLVPEKYSALYKNNPEIAEPDFYGMITNIDENFGKLRDKLRELNIEDNTILIFMTDNGSSGSCDLDGKGYCVKGYNAGMRGKKGSYYDGGHRVPFFIHWKNGGLENRDVDEIGFHVDFLPTLLDLCGIPFDEKEKKPDGISLKPLMTGEKKEFGFDRFDFAQFRQYTEPPRKWENAVICKNWRLVFGTELYDMRNDPEQRCDVSAQYPEIVANMRAQFEEYWKEVAPVIDDYQCIVLGNEHENPTQLNAMDVMGDVNWNQESIAAAQKSTGKWSVRFEKAGKYRFALRRWPEELGLPIEAPAGEKISAQTAPYGCTEKEHCLKSGVVPAAFARLKLFGEEYMQAVDASEQEAVFLLDVKRSGETVLSAEFCDEKKKILTGAYYVYVTRLED